MDRFTLAVVGGVLALVVAGLASAAILRDSAASRPPDPATPSGVVLTYAVAEQRGNPQAAWDLLATSTQTKADRERFLARAGSAYDHGYLSTEDERVDGDGASVVLVRTTPASGIFGSGSYSNRSTVRLVRETSGWRISVPPDDYLLIPAKP